MFDYNTFKGIYSFSSYYSAMQRATVLQLHYVVDHPQVGEGLI